MRTQGIRVGDLVRVDKKGRRFHAEIRERNDDGGFRIMPLQNNVSYREATAHEVVEHWRKSRQGRS